MARIALLKLFTGLNLAPAQLSAELQRAGHESRIIYFKNHEMVPFHKMDGLESSEFPGILYAANGNKMNWNCYKPFNEPEFQLLINELKEFNPDAIGLSLVSGIMKEGAIVTERLRQDFDIPIIWGGPGPNLEPEKAIETADVVCLFEGEEVIVEFADKIDAGSDLTDIKGTWANKLAEDGSKEIIRNPNRELLELNDIAIPNFNLEHYVHINEDKVTRGMYPHNLKDEYAIMTQRGCPFSCSFCIESRYQELHGKEKSLRRRDVDVVLEELRWAKANLPIKYVMFFDDVFPVNPRWLKEFLPRYKEEIGLPWWCYTYPNTHNPELLQYFKDHGCMSMTMGVQTGSERMLKDFYNRPTKIDRVIEAAQEIIDAGLTGYFDIITRSPVETEEDLKATLDFLMRFPPEMQIMGFSQMTNFPTYAYTREIEKRDLIAGDNPNLTDDDYDYYHKLWFLSRGKMPHDKLREVANDPYYREDHNRLNEFMKYKGITRFLGIAP